MTFANNAVKREYARFKGEAYSARIRSDGKVFVAGGETPVIQVFEMGTRLLLRQFKGHQSAIHFTTWASISSIMSCSDDKLVKGWDLPSQKQVTSFKGHEDYVRCGLANGNTWVSGSYDKTVKLWDTRVRPDSACTATLSQNSPVHSIFMLPNDILVSAGDTIRVWSHNRMLTELNHHIKPITCLSHCPVSKRLVSGSLDFLCKFYDDLTFELKHTMASKSPILSLHVDEEKIILGHVDGTIAFHEKEVKNLDPVDEAKVSYFSRGMNLPATAEDDQKVDNFKADRLKAYDSYLRKFRFSDALSAVFDSRNPLIIVSMMDDLLRRDVLKVALANRDEPSLEPILRFLIKNLTNPQFSIILMTVSEVIFDIYGKMVGHSNLFDQLVLVLQEKLHEEVALQKELLMLQGSMDMIFASSQTRSLRKAMDFVETIGFNRKRKYDATLGSV